MTNQNDTQDEAERLAEVMIASLVTMNNRPVHRPDVLKYAFKAGYRAGKEPQLNLNRMLLATNGYLKETVAAMQEELNQSKRETQAAVHLCEQSRAEVERLKRFDAKEWTGYLAMLEEQLAAEKSRAMNLVEAAKGAVKFMEAHKYHDFDESEPEFQMMAGLESALDDYSTDSGDGSSK